MRNGTIKGLSVGAIFARVRRPDGTADIVNADVVEWLAHRDSSTGVSGPGDVSEGKALEFFGRRSDPSDLSGVKHDLALVRARLAAEALTLAVAGR